MFKNPLINQRLRAILLQVGIVILFAGLWGQLIHIQIIKSPGLISKAKKRFENSNLLLRGDIRDRNGDLLVLDIITYDIYNNVREIKKIPTEKATKLAQILDLSKEDMYKKLSASIDTKIATKLSESKAAAIKKEDINFVYLIPQLTRQYPHKTLAAHIIGFVNSDHKGQQGVEYSHESLLTKAVENHGKTMVFAKGTDIVLTIDSVLQQYSENILKESIEKTKAERGTVLVLSPATGEIYTWAVYPTFDPNEFYKAENLKNWALTDVYEPGSTFKIITISSALESMAINKNSTFLDDGELKINNRTIRNHHKTDPQNINLLGLFQHSSNVVAGKIGLLIEPKDFYNYIKRFMISEKTNIDLPGESEGLLVHYKKWKKLDQATTAIGQGSVSVTPIQLASAVATIANEGLWIQPHILKGVWEPNYNLINDSPYNIVKEQAVSKDTADFISELLNKSIKANLKDMSYLAGNVEGYEVAGKTGTAQKIKPDGTGYWKGHTIASFIGYLPAKHPKILTLVVIDDPKTDGGWGNTVAGPVFNKISQFAAKRFLEEG